MGIFCSLENLVDKNKLNILHVGFNDVHNQKINGVRFDELSDSEQNSVIEKSFSENFSFDKNTFVKCGDDDKGKGTPLGDAKDRQMRADAIGFIGEIEKESSSSMTSFSSFKNQSDTIFEDGNTKCAYSNTVGKIMLARNSEFKGKALDDWTKFLIEDALNKGYTFIVGDMPNVDTQFIQYLLDLGAKPGVDFKIYHTKSPRVKESDFKRTIVSPIEDSIDVSFETKTESFKKSLSNVSNPIKRSETFAEDHTRTFNGKEIPQSVSSIKKILKGENNNNIPIDKTSAKIGNTFDAAVRDIFSGNPIYFDAAKYDGINSEEFNSIQNLCKRFKEKLENTEGIGLLNGKRQKFKIISGLTNEKGIFADIDLAGKIKIGNTEYEFAGSPDLVVFTENKDVFIFDMKTVKGGEFYDEEWKRRIEDYNIQQYLYKLLIENNTDYKVAGYGYFPVGKHFDRENNTYHFIYHDEYTNVLQTLPDILDGKEVTALFSVEDINDVEEYFGKTIAESLSAAQKHNTAQQEDTKPKDNSINVQNADPITFQTIALNRAEKVKYGTLIAQNILYYAQEFMNNNSNILMNVLDDKYIDYEVQDSLVSTLYKYGKDIIDYLKSNIEDEILESEKGSIEESKLFYILDNFEQLASQSNIIFKKFGVKLSVSESKKSNYTFEKENEEKEKNEENNETSNKEGDYEVNYRTLKLEQTIQNELKTKLSLIKYAVWEDGSIIESLSSNSIITTSFNEFVPLTEVLGVMFQNYRGISNSKELMNKMKSDIANQSVPAWMQQVYDIFESSHRYRAMAINSFYKAESSYSHIVVKKTKNEDGITEVIQEFLRENQLVDYHKDKVQRRFFSKRNYDENNITNTDSVPKLFFINDENPFKLQINKQLSNQWKTLTVKEKADALGVLECIDPRYLANEDSDEYFAIESALDGLKQRCDSALSNDSYKYNEAFGRKNDNSISRFYNEDFFSITKPYLSYAFEPTVYDGNSYAVINQISYVQRVIDDIAKNKTFDELRAKYMQSRLFYDSKRNKFTNSWLDWLLNTDNYTSNDIDEINKEFEERRSFLSHAINTSTAGKQYQKQTDDEKLVTVLTNYFHPSDGITRFRIPVMSDKQADESISFGKAEDTTNKTVKEIISEYNTSVKALFKSVTHDEYKYLASEDQVVSFVGKRTEEIEKNIASIFLCGKQMFSYFEYEKDRQMGVLEQWILGNKKDDIASFNIERKAEWEPLREKLKSLNSVKRKKKGEYRFKLTKESFDSLTKDEKETLKEIYKESRGLRFIYCDFMDHVKTKNGKNKGSYDTDTHIKDILTGFEYLDNTGVFENDFVSGFASFIVENAKSFFGENSNVIKDYFPEQDGPQLVAMIANDYLATCNIENLTGSDVAYYKNTIDFQKRNAQIHAMTIKPDVEMTIAPENAKTNDATFNKLISDGKFRYIVVNDLRLKSKLGEESDRILSEKIKRLEKNLNNANEDEKYRIKELIKSIDILKTTLKKSLSNIKEATDGQSFGCPTSFWKKTKMLGEDVSDFERALEEIRKGKYSFFNIQQALHPQQPIKSFIYDMRIKENSNTSYGVEMVPTQIKHSEAMLLAQAIVQEEADTPMAAMLEFMENSHYDGEEHSLETYVNDGVDCICYASTVKVGLHEAIDLGESYESAKKALQKVAKDKKRYIKELDYLAWGKALEVPAEMQNHEQGMGSQVKVLSMSDMEDNIPEFKIKHNGKDLSFSKKEYFIKHYFNLISEDMELGIEKMLDMMGIEIKTADFTGNDIAKERNIRLRDILVQQIDKDESANPNIKTLLELDENGNFKVPLNNPIISQLLYKTFFSLAKKMVNKQYMQGGPIVQAAPTAFASYLHAHDAYGHKFGEKGFNSDKGIIYDIAITAPTVEIENAMRVDEDYLKTHQGTKYKEGQYMTVKDAIEANRLTKEQQEQLKCIAYRIPTEDKYSIFRCNIVEIVPRTRGELIIMPPEITVLSGSDFDIDKMFIEFKFDNTSIQDKIANNTIENLDEALAYEADLQYKLQVQKIRNELFDMQWFALGLRSATENHINAGNFNELKELAEYVQGGKLTNANIFLLKTQFDLYKLNDAGKEFVGIAALNNISHAISNMAGVRFKLYDEEGNMLIPNLMINGFSLHSTQENGTIMADPTRCVFGGNNEYVSRVVGMFVGASADNAKEALLGILNVNGTTANVAMSMMRMGLPLDFVVALLTDSKVIELCKNGNLKQNLNELPSSEYDSIETLSGHNINVVKTDNNGQKNLRLEETTPKGKTREIDDKTKLGILKFFSDISDAYRNIDSVAQLNSTKNAAGPDIFTTLATRIRINELVNQDSSMYFDLGNSSSIQNFMFSKIKHLESTYKIFGKTLEDFVQKVDPMMYSFAFGLNNTLDMAVSKQLISNIYPEKDAIKALYNNYFVYLAYENKFLDNANETVLNFPSEFEYFANRIKGNDLVDFLLTKSKEVDKGRLALVEYENSFTIPDETKMILSESWADLLTNEKTRKFALDLYKYFFNRYGSSVRYSSLINIAPPEIYSYLMSSDDGLSFVESLKGEIADEVSFLKQFCMNNPKLAPRANAEIWGNIKSNSYNAISDEVYDDTLSDLAKEFGMIGSSKGTLYIISPVSENGKHAIKKMRLGNKYCLEYYAYIGENEIDDDNILKLNTKYQISALNNQSEKIYEDTSSNSFENDGEVDHLSNDDIEFITDTIVDLYAKGYNTKEIVDSIIEAYGESVRKQIDELTKKICK